LNSNAAGNSTEDDDTNKISVEVAAFCKDPTFPVAATGTIEKNSNGKIYIWDISKQVKFLIFIYKFSLSQNQYFNYKFISGS